MADALPSEALFETFVATELERQASWSVTPVTFWHYREQEREVDIIAERPSGELVGIEVKASATSASSIAAVSHPGCCPGPATSPDRHAVSATAVGSPRPVPSAC